VNLKLQEVFVIFNVVDSQPVTIVATAEMLIRGSFQTFGTMPLKIGALGG